MTLNAFNMHCVPLTDAVLLLLWLIAPVAAFCFAVHAGYAATRYSGADGAGGCKHHKVVTEALPAGHEVFPAGAQEPVIPAGVSHFHKSMQKDGTAHVASAVVPDPAASTTKKLSKVSKKAHNVDGHSKETTHVITEVTSAGAVKTKHECSSLNNQLGHVVKKTKKQQKRALRHRHLLQADLDDDTGYGEEETLSDSQVGVDDNGVSMQASNNINLAAGTNTNIVTGATESNNTAVQQTASTFEVTVSGPAVVGGRRLLAEERKQSLFRLDASGGIHMESKTGMTVQAETLQVTGSLAATEGLEVTGPLVANTGIAVNGDVALAGNLVIPASECSTE
jgi:hypothetical protein